MCMELVRGQSVHCVQSSCLADQSPLATTWPYLRCDVGLEEEGNIENNSVLQYCVLF